MGLWWVALLIACIVAVCNLDRRNRHQSHICNFSISSIEEHNICSSFRHSAAVAKTIVAMCFDPICEKLRGNVFVHIIRVPQGLSEFVVQVIEEFARFDQRREIISIALKW